MILEFQIFHYWWFCGANNFFFAVFFYVKKVRKISFSQSKRIFLWHLFDRFKKIKKKSFNSKYASKWLFDEKTHLFTELGAERSKKRLTKFENKGYPLLIFAIFACFQNDSLKWFVSTISIHSESNNLQGTFDCIWPMWPLWCIILISLGICNNSNH